MASEGDQILTGADMTSSAVSCGFLVCQQHLQAPLAQSIANRVKGFLQSRALILLHERSRELVSERVCSAEAQHLGAFQTTFAPSLAVASQSGGNHHCAAAAACRVHLDYLDYLDSASWFRQRT